MFVPDYPTDGLRGAEYNPRTITPETEAMLRESISAVGFAKPVLVQPSGRLIAGHQRTNAARALGRTTVPAFVIKDLELSHEMNFNQLHNGADVDTVVAAVRIPPSDHLGFHEVDHRAIEGNDKQPGASVRNEIYKLVSRYGGWGAAIATQSGEVLSSQQYALTCKQGRRPLRVFRVADDKREDVLRYFSREYGVFCYERLPKNTWLQTFAQPHRHKKNKDPDADVQSALYDLVRGRLLPGQRLLDFGCGYGQVLRELQRDGFSATGVEFFYKGNSDSLKPAVVHQMADDVCFELETNGLFDVVICDSVLNSVDSLQAESDVLTCLNAFCKLGGEILFSGRSRNALENKQNSGSAVRTAGPGTRLVEFLDKDGFSAVPLGDKWFYQKFHSREEARALAARIIGPEVRTQFSGAWQAWGRKAVELPLEDKRAAIRREFDLPWPGGKSVGKGDKAVAAFDAAYARELRIG